MPVLSKFVAYAERLSRSPRTQPNLPSGKTLCILRTLTASTYWTKVQFLDRDIMKYSLANPQLQTLENNAQQDFLTDH